MEYRRCLHLLNCAEREDIVMGCCGTGQICEKPQEIFNSAISHVRHAYGVTVDYIGAQAVVWKGRIIQVWWTVAEQFKNIVRLFANFIDGVVNSTSALAYTAQGFVMSFGVVKALKAAPTAVPKVVESLDHYRSFFSATRLPNSVGYFCGDSLWKDITNFRIAKMMSNLYFVPLNILSLFKWLESNSIPVFMNAARSVVNKIGSVACFGWVNTLKQLPLAAGLGATASLLWVVDRAHMIIKGKNVAYHAADGASAACDAAQTIWGLLWSSIPIGTALFGVASAATGLAAFFLDPERK